MNKEKIMRTIADAKYQACYLVEGEEGTEVLEISSVGLLTPYLYVNKESLTWTPDETPEYDEAQAILEFLHRADGSAYRVVEEGGEYFFEDYDEEYWPIRKITYYQGWFAVVSEGPFEDYEEALNYLDSVVPDLSLSDVEDEGEEEDYEDDDREEDEEDEEEDTEESDSDEEESDEDDEDEGNDDDEDEGNDEEVEKPTVEARNRNN